MLLQRVMTKAEKSFSLTLAMSEIFRCYRQCKFSYKRDRPHDYGHPSSDLLVQDPFAKHAAEK